MIVSILKIIAEPSNKEGILEILYSVKGPTEAKPGCLSSNVSQDLQDERVIYYKEVWQDKAALNDHIRSDLYRNIIAVMDMSSEPPDIKFNTISNTAGMELIKKTLGFSEEGKENAVNELEDHIGS